MKKLPIIKSLVAAAALLSSAWSSEAAVRVRAFMDSTQLLMGNTMAIHLDIVEPISDAQGQIVLQKDSTLIPEIEVRDIITIDTGDLGNNLRQIRREMIIQSFDSGDYIIPEIKYAIATDTTLSDKLALRVIPVDVSNMETINPDADIQNAESRWWDFLPAFIVDYWEWILISIIIIAAAVTAFLMLRKKGVKQIFKPQAPPLSPYEVAIRDLNHLKERNLCAAGNEKEYYTDLTDILRVYLQNRFGINAMEMTSSQITAELNKNDETRLPNRLMKQILEIADFVKFAKQRPLPEDNTRSFNSAMQFVEDTKPRPVEPIEKNPKA